MELLPLAPGPSRANSKRKGRGAEACAENGFGRLRAFPSRRDRDFESFFLQRRVGCELDSRPLL